VTDYRRFLGASSLQVLPYFGGPFVEAASRRLRLRTEAAIRPGYWAFQVSGRTATAVAPAGTPDLTGWPAVRGYLLPTPGGGYLVRAGGVAERFAIGPEPEPEPFAPLIGRRWPDGALLYEVEDFESGVEDTVRAAFAEHRAIGEVSGVPAPLRAAFGYAVLLRVSAERHIPVRPAEARTRLVELARDGDLAAHRILTGVREARAGAGTAPVIEAGFVADRPDPARQRSEERAANALRVAGAALRGLRWRQEEIQVRFDYEGEHFVSIVDGRTLQVLDAGICLNEHDEALTLESLPGVIREAVRSGQLNITAW
jgi:hypothetical protein